MKTRSNSQASTNDRVNAIVNETIRRVHAQRDAKGGVGFPNISERLDDVKRRLDRMRAGTWAERRRHLAEGLRQPDHVAHDELREAGVSYLKKLDARQHEIQKGRR
jgi:hypothetical protein